VINTKRLHASLLIVPTIAVMAGCGSSNPPRENSVSQQTKGGQSAAGDADPANLPTSTAQAANIQGFSVIREFGGTDTAGMFGLLGDTASIRLTKVNGPSFLGGFRLGELNQEAIDHLFLKSSNPMSEQEKQGLLSKYRGAQVIYFEGYNGNLCNSEETEYKISAAGTLNGAAFRATFQFIALPNATGDCKYHTFSTLIQK
jgi:hypothetical protein